MNEKVQQDELFGSAETAPSKPVTFRLDRVTYQRLEAEASGGNLSIGALAKKRLLAGEASPTASPAFEPRIADIEANLVALRADLILSVEAILFAGGKLSPEQAKEFVTKKLSPAVS